MKQWGKITGYLFAMLLAFVSLQAQAATKAQDREFDHTHTGFPITGVHATTQCETCHVGGVFVGTPRACDGCHAVGKRVVATPKSLKHIVTDAPCETCHFNTSTFYGARYNHGTAVPGQCTNCHNGRIVEGTPRNHPVSPIAGASCDSCHRSSSWLPASWNHTNTAADCSDCHKAGGPGRNYTSAGHGSYNTLGILATCKECHTNYYTFYSYRYKHNGPGAVATCGDCHAKASYANGVTQAVSAIHAAATSVGISACQSCHTGYATFFGARYRHDSTYDFAYQTKMASGSCAGCHDGSAPPIKAIPTNHTNAFAAPGLVNPAAQTDCTVCHSSTSTWNQMNHATALVAGGHPCKNCHDSSLNPPGASQKFSGMVQRPNGHKRYDNASQDCINCHTDTYSYWNEP